MEASADDFVISVQHLSGTNDVVAAELRQRSGVDIRTQQSFQLTGPGK